MIRVVPLGENRFVEVPEEPDAPSDPHKRWVSDRAKQQRQYWGLPTLPYAAPREIGWGYTKSTAKRLWTIARKKAKADMKMLEDKKIIAPDEAGNEALEMALVIMRAPGDKKNQLAAARLVLEYTKAKPQAKSEVTLKGAEAWLEQIANDEG